MTGCRDSRLQCPSGHCPRKQCKAGVRSGKEGRSGFGFETLRGLSASASLDGQRMAAVPHEHSQRLIPFRAATWAGPSGAGTSDQRRRAESGQITSGAGGIAASRSRKDGSFVGNHQVNQKRNCARKRDKSEAPVKGRRIRIGRGRSRKHERDRRRQTKPIHLKERRVFVFAWGSRWHMPCTSSASRSRPGRIGIQKTCPTSKVRIATDRRGAWQPRQ